MRLLQRSQSQRLEDSRKSNSDPEFPIGYTEAIATLGSLRTMENAQTLLLRAASHAALGNTDESHRVVGRALQLEPEATIRLWTSTDRAFYKDAKDLEHLRDNLRKAGLPE